jgi:hypothetical protein
MPGSSLCAPCAIGKYQPMASASSCLLCPPGAFCGVTGLTAPVACDAQTSYNAVRGATACSACAFQLPNDPIGGTWFAKVDVLGAPSGVNVSLTTVRTSSDPAAGYNLSNPGTGNWNNVVVGGFRTGAFVPMNGSDSFFCCCHSSVSTIAGECSNRHHS